MLFVRAKLALGCLAVATLVIAGQAKKDDKVDKKEPEDKQVVSTKPTKVTPAASVNFRKDLGLPFDSLSTLGSRIDAARRKPDPVALAHAANELHVAEKVSGKTASVTSKQLLKESGELAAMRRQAAELKAQLQIANQMQFEEDHIKMLKENLSLANAQVKSDKEYFDRKEEPTSKPRKVVVNNYSTQYVDVYVNGHYKVQVTPGSTQVITIEHRWNPTILKAYGDEDINTWGPRYIWGRFDKYTWNINGGE
jgi:hypothetical protein